MSDVCAGERKLGIGTGKVWGNALIIEVNFIFYISIYGVDIPLLPGTVNTFEITFCLLCVFLLRLWRQSSCPGKFWGWKNKKMTWCGGLGHWSQSCYKWRLSSRILNHCKEIKRFLKCIDNLRKGDRKTLVASGCTLHHCALCRAACLSHPRLVGMRDPLDLIHYVLCVWETRKQFLCLFLLSLLVFKFW